MPPHASSTMTSGGFLYSKPPTGEAPIFGSGFYNVLYVYPAKFGLLNVAIGKLARLTVFNKVHIQALQIPSTMLSHEVASTENGLANPTGSEYINLTS